MGVATSLPVVSNDTYGSVAQSAWDYDSDKNFTLEYSKHIKEVNPVVLSFMIDWVEELDGEDFFRGLMGMIIVYKMLESQAEANLLEEELGG